MITLLYVDRILNIIISMSFKARLSHIILPIISFFFVSGTPEVLLWYIIR